MGETIRFAVSTAFSTGSASRTSQESLAERAWQQAKTVAFSKLYPKVTSPQGWHPAQIALGPRKILTGKKSIALNNSKTP